MVTNISLLELSDLNHPLLRRMVIEAPGTYHHSLVVSALAEGACERMGANSLLARVGAYFHDIGKMEHSEYFTENQADEQKKKLHELLAPETSHAVITRHVQAGVELAKKYKLKQPIIDFIPEHQGTYPVYYFYNKAAEYAKKNNETVSLDDFRYPGPKPQSRETAAVMLADSVEAASRSLNPVTPETIDKQVSNIINLKFTDGQLDECDLTFRDLRVIHESFVHNLMGVLHTRIQYPKADVEPVWQKVVGRKDRSND